MVLGCRFWFSRPLMFIYETIFFQKNFIIVMEVTVLELSPNKCTDRQIVITRWRVGYCLFFSSFRPLYFVSLFSLPLLIKLFLPFLSFLWELFFFSFSDLCSFFSLILFSLSFFHSFLFLFLHSCHCSLNHIPHCLIHISILSFLHFAFLHDTTNQTIFPILAK